MSATGLQTAWQSRGALAIALWPVSLLYGSLVKLRSLLFSIGWLKRRSSVLPVIVVGNLSVGGTGKTPLCAWLVRHFEEQGYRPGIVSRGHGGRAHRKPYRIDPDSDTAAEVGDEPLMMAQQTGVPVCVCIDRAAAVAELESLGSVDVVFSDDGLQHLAMQRTAELVVIDATRGLGNGWLLPAGPLRESVSRLLSVDLLVVNGQRPEDSVLIPGLPTALVPMLPPIVSFDLTLNTVRHISADTLGDAQEFGMSGFSGKRVHAVAGIGHPQRFFSSLEHAGMEVIPHPKPDHHVYTASDLMFGDDLPVMVTSKDAVKLRRLDQLPANIFEVPVELRPDPALLESLTNLRNDHLRR